MIHLDSGTKCPSRGFVRYGQCGQRWAVGGAGDQGVGWIVGGWGLRVGTVFSHVVPSMEIHPLISLEWNQLAEKKSSKRWCCSNGRITVNCPIKKDSPFWMNIPTSPPFESIWDRLSYLASMDTHDMVFCHCHSEMNTTLPMSVVGTNDFPLRRCISTVSQPPKRWAKLVDRPLGLGLTTTLPGEHWFYRWSSVHQEWYVQGLRSYMGLACLVVVLASWGWLQESIDILRSYSI